MKQIGLALHNYHDTQGIFPPSSIGSTISASTNSHHNFNEFLLPFVDQAPLYNSINFSLPVTNGSLQTALVSRTLVFQLCPSNPYAATLAGYDYSPTSHGACYQLNAGPKAYILAGSDCAVAGSPAYCAGSTVDAKSGFAGMGNLQWAYCSRIRDITDGTSNTLAAGEVRPEIETYFGMWGINAPGFTTSLKINSPVRVNYQPVTSIPSASYPNSLTYNHGMSSFHVGGAHALLADGAVRFLSENISFQTLNYLGHKADGQTLGEF